jgi:WD40 repeat protein
MPDGVQIGEGKVGGAINELDFTTDDRLLVAAGDKAEVRIFDTRDMRLAKQMKWDEAAPTITVRFSPDDSLVAAGGHNGHVLVWSVADGRLVRHLNFTGRKVETLTFSPDGQHLLYAGHDPHIRVVRLSDWALVHESQAVDNAEYIAFSRNGSFLASAHQDGVVRVWVWMRGDAELNKRLHRELTRQQDEEDARNGSR